MKLLKTTIYTIALLFSVTLLSQGTQNVTMKIDSIGNAKLDIAMTMNAQQWQIWNESLGKNPSALKRDVERSMPGYFLDDFKLEKDDMNRSFKVSLKAYGICDIDKRGKWSVNTDQKNANLTELTSHKYLLVGQDPELGNMVQQYTIEFPETATNIEVEKDAFGNSIFEFKMDNPASGGFPLKWAGLVLFVIGGAWTGKALLDKKS